MRTRLLLIPVLALFLAGCSIQIVSNKLRDGGVFRSDDAGATWAQKVTMPQTKGKAKNISSYDVLSLTLSPFNQDEMTVTTANNGVVRTFDAGETWAPVATFTTGEFFTFAYDPSVATTQYSAYGNTVLKSIDAGATWTAVYTDTRGALITAVAVDRFDTQRIYAGTNGGTILKSVNGGTEWKTLTTLGDFVRQIVIRNDDTRIVYVALANSGISRTTDGGATWTDLKALRSFSGAATTTQLLPSTTDAGTLYLASTFGLLKSVNGGDTWTEIKTLLPSGAANIRTVGIDPNASSTIYFSVNNLVHKSDDGGATWQTISTVPTNRILVRMLVHPAKSGTIFLGAFKPK